MYGKEKIAKWKDEDDPSFHRFASKLKIALETLNFKIQKDLERHDRLLKDMQTRIEEIQVCMKSMGTV